MIQTFYSFNWDVFVEDAAINFKTDGQKNFVKKIKNHRMAMDILLVMEESLDKELIVPFISFFKKSDLP